MGDPPPRVTQGKISGILDRPSAEELLIPSALFVLIRMSADTWIPVSEATRNELHALKEPDQTYDDLLIELTQQRRRKELAARFRKMDELAREEFVPLEEG